MLDQRLREHGSPWRVGTAAKSGYSTADYVARSAIFRSLHNPDWVVILVSDNDFGSDAWKKRLAGYAYFEWDGADNLRSVELAYSERSLSGWASDHAALLQPGAVFLANRIGAIQGWLKDNEQPWFHAPPLRPEHSGERASLTAYPVEKEMGLLRAAYAGRLTLLYLAPFDPKEPPRKTENEAVLQKAAKQNGIEFLSLREKYFGLSRSGHCPYGFSNTRFNEGHMNRHGHKAVAGLLYDYITSER